MPVWCNGSTKDADIYNISTTPIRESTSMKLSAIWRKSTSCGPGDCLEVRQVNELVELRNSRNPHSGIVSCSIDEWNAFLDGVTNKEFEV